MEATLVEENELRLFLEAVGEDKKGYLYLLLGNVEWVHPIAVFKIDVDKEITTKATIIGFKEVVVDKRDDKCFSAYGFHMNPCHLRDAIISFNTSSKGDNYWHLAHSLYDFMQDPSKNVVHSDQS